MSNIKYQAITEALSEIKANQLDEQFNINPFRKKPPSYDEIGASLSKSASKATPLPNVEFEPDRATIHDVLDKSSIFPVSNLSKVSIPGGLAAGAYSKDGKDLSINPNFIKAMDARNNKLLPRALREQSLTEDGHTDVPSSIRMCKTIMEDAHDILCALCNTDMDEEIDTWWTNKLAVSASTLNKLRDYYVHEVDHEEQPDEADMEIEEQSPADPQRMTGKSRLSRPQMTATKDIPVGGGGGGASFKSPPARGTGPAIYTRDKSFNPFEGMGKSKDAGTTAFVVGSGLAAALGATAGHQAQERRKMYGNEFDIQEESPLVNPNPKIARQAKSIGDVRLRGGVYAPAGPSAEGVYTSKGPLSIDPDYVNRVNQANISRNKELGYPSYSKSVLQRVQDFVKPGGPLAPRGYSGIIPALRQGKI